MKAKDLIESWRNKAIEDGQEISTLDILVFQVVEDARRRGISRIALTAAAGGSLRRYFRDALLASKPNVKPELNDVLGNTYTGRPP